MGKGQRLIDRGWIAYVTIRAAWLKNKHHLGMEKVKFVLDSCDIHNR